MRKRLVLDVGGVLFGEGFRPLLGSLAEAGGYPAENGVAHYNQHLRPGLWRGGITVDQFWGSFGETFSIPEEELARLVSDGTPQIFQALPALDRLRDWAQRVELWILSNHRHEWLRPELERRGLDQVFDRIIISSEVGLMKPDKGIYATLRDGSPDQVLFVDDKDENIEAAFAIGAVDAAVLADRDGLWLTIVDGWTRD